MKIQLQFLSCLLTLIISITSCNKSPEVTTYSPPPGPSIPPTPIVIDNKEYFWGYSWQKISGGYEMKLNSLSLTDAAINRGISVHLAIYTDWSMFNQLPLTLRDQFLPDTINLSYTAMRGQLQVFAKAPFDLVWASDVFIEYK